MNKCKFTNGFLLVILSMNVCDENEIAMNIIQNDIEICSNKKKLNFFIEQELFAYKKILDLLEC